MVSEIWTVLPMRGIERSKSRLATVVDAAGRTSLNRRLLTGTLTVVGQWGGDLRRCVVVSPCEQVLAQAQHAGALVLREAQDANDLNRAVALGASYAAANGAARILILPCDLPDLAPESLAALASEAEGPLHMVIAPDKAGTGTNALLLDARPDIGFCFGKDSFRGHFAWAGARGWTVSVCSRPDLEFDLDTPEDLAEWTRRSGARVRGADMHDTHHHEMRVSIPTTTEERR